MESNVQIKLVYVCIPTTPERREQTARLVKTIHETANFPHVVVEYENLDGGWVPAVYNMLEGINGFVSLLGSDVVPKNDWLKILVEAFLRQFPYGDGVAEPFNEFHGPTMCQHPFAHTDTIKKYLHRGYTHWYSDNEFTERAILDGKLLYVPQAEVEHRHFMNKKAELDETYKTIFNEETIKKDRELFAKRKSLGYPND